MPQIALGLVGVILPLAYSRADVAWLQIVAGVLKTDDLGQCTRRQAVDDWPCTCCPAAARGAGTDLSWPSTRHRPFRDAETDHPAVALKRRRAVATRYDKLAVRYEATVLVAAINEWL
ncbi:hypothetical protein [Streptomyces sp. NPDC058671]|uniref:hypothetical protein n=1 Tax=Streptomyces sp. NPDC058671 TaxID=3346590 RepID=UPI00365126ED